MAKGKEGHRKVYVKWKGYARPSWEPLDALKDNVAVDCFEEKYSDITLNDGPSHGERRVRGRGGVCDGPGGPWDA